MVRCTRFDDLLFSGQTDVPKFDAADAQVMRLSTLPGRVLKENASKSTRWISVQKRHGATAHRPVAVTIPIVPHMETFRVEVKKHTPPNTAPVSPMGSQRLAFVRSLQIGASQVLGPALAAVIIGMSSTSPVGAQPLQLSSLVTPSTHEHHVGKVILVQLVTPDLSEAKRFYGKLFGWNFRNLKIDGEDYAEASLDGQPVAGLMHKAIAVGERRQSNWLTFIAVRDVDATKKLAVTNGAKVLLEPRTIPNRGREAVFSDPQGAVFAVLASSSGDPPDEMADPGEWIWSSLSTTDPDANAGFYQTLFDYEVFDLPADQGARHLMLASDNYARASVNTLPTNRPNARPHWLNYIHVEDVAAASAEVISLGGRVLVEPRLDRHGGKVAIVADPLGASFGLLEWPDAQGKEVTK
jgi:predicted enzyme related to lactoylglutathione lyase